MQQEEETEGCDKEGQVWFLDVIAWSWYLPSPPPGDGARVQAQAQSTAIKRRGWSYRFATCAVKHR